LTQHISHQLKDNSDIEQHNPFKGLVVAHAAVNSRMMTNPGRYLARFLVKEGVTLHFYASQLPIGGWPPDHSVIESIGARFCGFPLPQYFAPFHELWSLILLVFVLRRDKVDIIHTRGSVMGALGRVAAKLAGVPIIIHHQDDLYCRDGNLSPMMKRFFAFIERSLAKLADRLLFISQAVLDDAIAVGFPSDRCVLVGIDLHEVFQEAANEQVQSQEHVLSKFRSLGIPENTKIVASVARLAKLKGHDIFIEAARSLADDFPDWVFVIKGNGPLREQLKTLIQQSGLENRVFMFTEELPFEELPALYRCLDIFALPTRREGFGMVFMEAMAMGVPVIGPRIEPITEIIVEDTGVLIEPENPKSLAEGLRELMINSDHRQQLALKGQQHALATWANQNAAQKALDVYHNLIILARSKGSISIAE
jgi:glycosyltransferase involved in cell wall biosynthesis